MPTRPISQEEHWKQYYSNDSVINISNDLQMNIARTRNGKRVDENIWQQTIRYIKELLQITPNSDVLEMCCGNGVIIGEIAPYCRESVGIDYSQKLLDQLKHSYRHKNLSVRCADASEVDLGDRRFDAVIFYFAIQHFNERAAYLLIEKCIHLLKDRGRMLIGDIPDLDRKWNYVNTPEYHRDYFQRVVECRPKIGYWYQRGFFRAMNSCFPDTRFRILDQPDYQINTDRSFDVLIERNHDA